MNTIKYTHYLLLTICFTATFYAQTNVQLNKKTDNDFQKITDLYSDGKLNDTVYMGMVDSLAVLSLDKGIFYTVNEMSNNMKQYEKIAWSKDDYNEYRNDYFVILLNNAYLSAKWGASIYYAEKVSKQNEIDGTPRPLIEQSVKTYIYGLTGRDDKVLELFENNQKLFEDLEVKIKEDPYTYYWEGFDALRILAPTVNIYFQRKDTLPAEKVYKLANSLINSIKTKSDISISSKHII